jgi:hypothetical protein
MGSGEEHKEERKEICGEKKERPLILCRMKYL